MIWNEIWQKKAMDRDKSDREINGWESTKCESTIVYETIKNELNLSIDCSILEIGCGVGYLSKEFIGKKYDFEAIDKSHNMISKIKEIYPNNVFNVSEANSLNYKDKSFDYVIMFSVAQYFNNLDYFFKTIEEMKRVSRKGIYVGDLVLHSKREEHLKIPKENFVFPWKLSQGIYTSDRYNAFLINKNEK